MTLKTTPSCLELIPHRIPQWTLIVGSAEHSTPLQLKTAQGGFLRFTERTFLNSVMKSNNPKMEWYNYKHNITFNFEYLLTWFNDYFALHL